MLDRQVVRVSALVQEVYAELRPRLAVQRVEAVADVPTELCVLADGGQLRRAIENLATNALEAMSAGGKLWITAFLGPHGLELEVADSGPGLSDEVRRHVFQPHFTTKKDGAGMGLQEVYHIAEAHGGNVRAANCPEGGAAFTLRFPTEKPKAAA